MYACISVITKSRQGSVWKHIIMSDNWLICRGWSSNKDSHLPIIFRLHKITDSRLELLKVLTIKWMNKVTYACMQAHMHTRMHTHTHACTHAHTHTHACKHTCTHACKHTCTHIHTRKHTHTRTHSPPTYPEPHHQSLSVSKHTEDKQQHSM